MSVVAGRTLRIVLGVLSLTPVVLPARAQGSRRDSAGIRIHTYAAAGPPVSVPADPILDVGGDERAEPLQFDRIRGVVRQATGTLVVANAGTRQIRFIDPQGRLTATVGRKGGGPGEFEDISDLTLLAGDSLLVHDAMLRRLTVLAPGGQLVRTIPLQAPTPEAGSVTLVAGLPDGTFLVGFSEIRTMVPQAAAAYFMQRLYRYGTTGEVRGGLGRFPGNEHFVQAVPMSMGGTAYWSLAFGRRFTVRGHGSGFLGGDGTSAEVQLYSPLGAVKEIHRLPTPPRRVTPQDIAEYGRREVTSQDPVQRRVEEKLVAEMPFPKTFPAYRTVSAGPDGRIWLENYRAPGDSIPVWVMLEPRTLTTRAVRMPARFRAMLFGESWVAGVWRDEDDVEHLRVYPVP